MLPLIRGLLPHPQPARRIPNRATRTCRRTRLPRFNAPVGDVPRDQRAGLPPPCSRWTASVAARSSPWRALGARSGAADVGGSPHLLRVRIPPAHDGPPGLRSVAGGQGPCDAVCWLQARLVQPLPPRAMRASFTCRHRKSHFGGGFAPRPKPLRSPGYFRERKGRSRRPSDAGPRADRAPLCGKSRAAPVPVQQLPGRLTNSEWPVFVPGGAPCLLYRRSRRRSIRGDRSSCFRLRMRPLSRHPRRRSAQRPAPPASSSSRPPRLPSG